MNKLQHILLLLSTTVLIAGCSTTSALEDGDQLYTGIHKVEYLQPGEESEVEQSDSVGVILAIADAAQQVEDALKGVNKTRQAQTQPDRRSLSKEDKKALKERRKADKEDLATAQVQVDAVLAYPPNNSLFGSSYYRIPLPLGLWAYNKYTNSTSGFGRWMFRCFASDPVLISTINPDTRVKVATNTLHNYGFFRGTVDYTIETNRHNPRKAKMNYTVDTGPVFRLDSICYIGFPPLADSLIHRTMRNTYLRKGDAFNVLNLTSEQDRLEDIFRNVGYYYYDANFATYKADTVQTPMKVQLQMILNDQLPDMVNRQYYIGDTYVSLYRNSSDTIVSPHQGPGITYSYSGDEEPLHTITWLQNISHRPGRLYRQVDQENTEDMLAELGIFSQVGVSYQRHDTLAGCDTLDVLISATLDKPYTADLEFNVTSKNTDRMGPGFTFSLQRKNLWRGAELLNFEIYGSFEWRTHQEDDSGDDFFNSYNIGGTVSLDIPHIVFPFLNSRSFHFPTTTSFSFTVDWLNRASYFNMISFITEVTYSWHKNRTSRHEFTPLSLTYDRLLSTTSAFDDIMEQTPSLYISMRDRLVPAMQYTYTYTSSQRHRNPFTWQLTLKEAGNITSAIFALTGKPFNESGKKILSNQFAQYFKIVSELTNTFRIQGDYKLVTHLVAGALFSYGNTTVAPYNDQFYCGGANSIRGFTIRTVGPGHYYTPQTRYSYMDQTGECKLEASAELRFPLAGGLNGAIFVDAGNVWLMRSDEARPGGQLTLKHFLDDIALSTGAGLRYDLSFLVLRLDLGIAIHDPAENGRSGYYNLGKFSNALALHFAIGYPF